MLSSCPPTLSIARAATSLRALPPSLWIPLVPSVVSDASNRNLGIPILLWSCWHGNPSTREHTKQSIPDSLAPRRQLAVSESVLQAHARGRDGAPQRSGGQRRTWQHGPRAAARRRSAV